MHFDVGEGERVESELHNENRNNLIRHKRVEKKAFKLRTGCKKLIGECTKIFIFPFFPALRLRANN